MGNFLNFLNFRDTRNGGKFAARSGHIRRREHHPLRVSPSAVSDGPGTLWMAVGG
jgi:hypothetical protein